MPPMSYKRVLIGKPAADAARHDNAPPGRASAVEAAARKVSAALASEKQAAAANADDLHAEQLRAEELRQKTQAEKTARLEQQKKAHMEKSLASLQQRKQRLAAGVKLAEGKLTSSADRTHETRYKLCRDTNKLQFVTDSLLLSGANSSDLVSSPERSLSAGVNAGSPVTKYALPTPTELRSGATDGTSELRDPAEAGPSSAKYAAVSKKANEARPEAQKLKIKLPKGPTVPAPPLEKAGPGPGIAEEKDRPSLAQIVRDAAASVRVTRSEDSSEVSEGEIRDDSHDHVATASTDFVADPVVEHALDSAAEQLEHTSLNADDSAEVTRSAIRAMIGQSVREALGAQPQPPAQANPAAAGWSQPPADVMSSMLTKMGSLFDEIMALKARPSPQHVSRSAVRINDVKLSVFSGNSDSTAALISQAYYLPLIRWIKESNAALKYSGLAIPDQCTVVLNHLKGAARSAFFAKHGHADRSQWTLDLLFRKIANLVPEYDVLFTRAALEMKFRARSLVDDIDTFAMYLRYGCLQLDGNQFVFSELQKKMIAAVPKIFTLAADLHNMRLVWNKEKGFSWRVATAIEIVNALQANQQLLMAVADIPGRKEPGAGSPSKREGNPFATKRKAPKDWDDKKSGKSVKRVQGKDKKAQLKSLAKRFSRCMKCGLHVPNQDWKGHASASDEKSKCTPSKFETRMGKVASMVAKGLEDKVNEFPGKK